VFSAPGSAVATLAPIDVLELVKSRLTA